MPTKKPFTKPVKRQCKYKFNDAELLDIGRGLADLNERLANLEAEKKSVTSDFASKIAAVEGEIASDSNHIRSGYEYRSLDCTIHFDKPRVGRKQFIRDDNGEIVGDEAMEDYDRQAVLDFEKSEAE